MRRTFTATLNKLNELVDVEDKNIIQVSLNQLVDKADRLFSVDEAIKSIIYNLELDEGEIENEVDLTESYRDKYLEARWKMELATQRVLSDDELSSTSKGSKCKGRIRLPKIEIRKYDGSVKNYINFWAQFKQIHEDEELKLENKFQYLIQSTVEGSPARQLVESFPPCAENYDKAIQLLKKRFGREELLIEYYVRELLNIVLAKQSRANDETHSLRELYDSLETKLRSLETLGVTKDKFECMLRPLVESALPDEILKEWERRSSSVANRTLENLMEFLRGEVEGEERLKLSKGFKTDERKSPSSKLGKRNLEPSKKPVTAAALVNVRPQSASCCIFCQGRHSSEDCYRARQFTLEEMQKVLRNKGCCFRCLRKGHSKRQCRAFFRCVVCDGGHLALFCPQRKRKGENIVEQNQHVGNSLSVNNISHTKHSNHSPVLMQTLKVKLKGANDYYARVLIDTGSQRSYLTKRVAKMLDLSPFREEKITHVLFGGEQMIKVHKCYFVEIESLINNYSVDLEVLDSEVICNAVPAATGPWIKEMQQKGISLSDGKTGPIDILIGADVAGNILTGRREVLSCGLVAIETVLGWTLMGRIKGDYSQFMSNICLLISDYKVSDLWKLEVLGIEDSAQTKTKREMLNTARHNFLKTLQIEKDGRYQISIPWLEEHPPLPNNFGLAEKRLRNVIKKLKVSGLEEAYSEVFKQWVKEEIIEEVPFEDWCKGHYLPHRPVIKEGSTTRIRPVFDASARMEGHPALNQCLEKGDNLLELIPNIILRFRTDKIGVVADIRKAFLQISVNPDDRDFLRFLWQDPGSEEIKIYRHKRVVFGVSCSPFLLGAVMEHHLCKCEELIEQGKLPYSKMIIKQLQKSFYVDNCVAAVPEAEYLELFIEQATEIFKIACFDSWRHISGEVNPADLASRGCMPQFFIVSKWWEGPSWLKEPPDRWPKDKVAINEEDINQEKRKTAIAALINVEQVLTSEVLSRYFSRYTQIVRLVGWMIRFLFNHYSSKGKMSGELSMKEVQRAERLICRIVQKEFFEGLEDERLKKLKPQLDSDGLIRLRTKIWARKDNFDFRAPYILPAGNVIVQRLIYEVHQQNGHIVGQGLLNLLRERFWIVQGRRAIRSIVKKCGICQRHMSRAFNMETPPLPEARVRDAKVFEISGVDFAGPLYLCDGRKVWLCLFTCAVYRVVHLDLVSSLSTDSFMLAFKRFIFKRGRPTIMYSDKGTNFRAAMGIAE